LDIFIKDINSVLYDLLNPAVISVLTTLGASTIPLIRYVAKKNKEQKQENDERMIKFMKDVQDEVNSLKMMLLRHEILDAVRNDSLSVEDVMALYDQYKAVGGNSFITEEVHRYVERKKE
jgi:hypothetical protein